jgi:DNA-binding protein HU-beta
VIKLDIINEVVAKTGITKTKAELAVETVFESMKKASAQDRNRTQPAHRR